MIERIAGKDYTTLANIERMRELCRVEVKVPDCGSESAADGQRSWVIRDGSYQKGTGCIAHDIVGAERALATYIASKHVRRAQRGSRDPEQIPIADVLTVYLTDIVPSHSRPKETKGRIARLDAFFGDKMLSYVTGEIAAPMRRRSTDAAARRELEIARRYQSSSARGVVQ